MHVCRGNPNSREGPDLLFSGARFSSKVADRAGDASGAKLLEDVSDLPDFLRR